MYKIFFTVIVLFFISGCGGSGGSSSDPAAGGGGSVAQTVSGTAATGAPLVGVVNVYGSNGGSLLAVPINPDGSYSADVTGLTPPYFLCAVPTDTSLAQQYGWAAGPGIANITPLTSLAMFYANGGQNLAPLVDAWPANSADVTANLPAAQDMVNANFVDVFSAISPLLDTDFNTNNLFTTPFVIGDIFDQILDIVDVDLSGDTPVVDVIGDPGFSFDPDIGNPGGGGGDGSGGGGGGSGGGDGSGGGGGPGGESMGFGTLTVVGVDVPVIGSSITPITGVALVSPNSITGTWLSEKAKVVFGYAKGILKTVNVNFITGTEGNEESYEYAINCDDEDCDAISLNPVSRELIFLSAKLKGIPDEPLLMFDNPATGPITLDGTLDNWVEPGDIEIP